jgi:hypothetical protein
VPLVLAVTEVAFETLGKRYNTFGRRTPKKQYSSVDPPVTVG